MVRRKAAKSRAEVAKLLGVSERAVANWLASGCPGKPGKYDLAKIQAWRKEHRQPSRRSEQPEPVTVWERRLKKEKAKMARLDRLRRQGELVDRSAAITCWTILSRRLKQLGSSLQKSFGPAAAKMVNETIEDCTREVEATFADDDRSKPAGDRRK